MSTPRILVIIAVAIGMLYGASALLQNFVFKRYQQSYIGAAMLGQALSEASMVKRHIVTYYAEYGRLPADNEALGLGPPESFAREALDSLEVRDGHILMTLNDRIGEGAALAYRVERSRTGLGGALRWHCESPDIDEAMFRTAAPQCRHVETLNLGVQPVQAPAFVASAETLVNALHLNRKNVVREVIAAGIDLNVSHQGLYPLEMAIDKGDAGLVEQMLLAGADPNHPMARRDGQTMLAYACQASRRSNRILQALIRAGGDIEARDRQGRTPLMLAARAGNSTILDTLLKAGAELDAIDHRGTDALSYAATHGAKSSVYRRLASARNQRNEIIVVIPERD